MYLSAIDDIKRKSHLSVVWNWHHFAAIAICPTESADINTRSQLNDTRCIPPMHGGFLLRSCLTASQKATLRGTTQYAG